MTLLDRLTRPTRRQSAAYRELADRIHVRFCRVDDVLDCPCGFRQEVPHHHCQAAVDAENIAASAWRLHHPVRFWLSQPR